MAWGKPKKKSDALRKFAAQGGKRTKPPRGASAYSRAAYKYGKTSITKRELDSVRRRKPKPRQTQDAKGNWNGPLGYGINPNKPLKGQYSRGGYGYRRRGRKLPQGRPMRPGYADSRAGFGYGKNKPGGGRF